MCKNPIGFIAVAAAIVGATGAHAQSTYADMVNSLEAQLNILQKREQVDAALRRNVDPSLTSLPQVVAVQGMEGDLKARLMLATGVIITYGEGDQINPVMQVAAITPRQVTVAVKPSGKKAKTALVPLQFQAGASMSAGGGMGGLMMPPIGVGAPLPPGLLPTPPAIPGMQMPTPLLQQQRAPLSGTGQAAGTAAVVTPGVASGSGVPTAPAQRPDQDLIDAGAKR